MTQIRKPSEDFKYPEWAKMPEDYDFSTKGSSR